jgi:AAA family ATP:ADP antiporter
VIGELEVHLFYKFFWLVLQKGKIFMLNRFAQTLWGTFESTQERMKFVRLAAIFAFIIGVYSIVQVTKDVVFLHTVGINYLPYVKIFSLFITIPLIFLYGKLVDLFSRHHVFYIICVGYAVIFCLFGIVIMHPSIGLANTVLSPFRILGWLWYAVVEGFGSIIVSLTWSFISDVTTPESAKRGFPVIALGAQLGGVLGPLVFYSASLHWGPIPFIFIGALGSLCIGLSLFYFMSVTPAHELIGFHEQEQKKVVTKTKTEFLEGLGLISSSAYLIGIVAVVTLYEVIITIFEFHVKTLAQETYCMPHDLNCFLFKSMIYTNGFAAILLLLGIGTVGRNLGLLRTLLLLPCFMALGVLLLFFHFDISTALFVFVGAKGLNHALNQPAKEQLYIPTSKASRYKAKAWIDIFGSRMAKGAGSSVHILRPVLQLAFVGVSSLISFSLIVVWILAAFFVGKAHAKAIKHDKTIC